ncbi:MAG: transcriptional regulator, family [Frankiales bacterium]|nr:transcriptional regulator, family [Frankiales bacterium]
MAAAETGTGGMDARLLSEAAALVGLRLALLDGEGREVAGMADGAVRDHGGRRFPAHLDTRYGDERWWHGDERYSRPKPWFTFDRDRETRDSWRRADGTPDDHQHPQPGDAPWDRGAARQRAASERQKADFRERLAAGEVFWPEPFVCGCPPECDELDNWTAKPVHAPDCTCCCDL